MENMESSVQKPVVTKIDLRPKVLELIKNNGPLVPRDISKEIGQNTFITGAMLAQLRDSGEILASNTKVGGSPAYYVQGQEENLQILEKFLDQKSREAYLHLKENIILRDYEQSTQDRFCLRQLKDFAVDLTVEVRGVDEIFWKWYLTPIDEAEKIIMSIINEENEIIRQKELIESKKKEAIDKIQQEEFIEAEIQRRLKEKLDKLNFEKKEIEILKAREEIKKIETPKTIEKVEDLKVKEEILVEIVKNMEKVEDVLDTIKEEKIKSDEMPITSKPKKEKVLNKTKEKINDTLSDSYNSNYSKIGKIHKAKKEKEIIIKKIGFFAKIKRFFGF